MATKRITTSRKITHLTVAQSTVVSTGEWLVSLIILAIPVVGLVMTFVWAFGGGSNCNKRNFARAALILMAAAIVLSLVFGLLARSLLQGVINAYLNLIKGL